ncbi:hypothetical protein EYZ11_002864 [Aspergillus tanneri]|uniref:Uncharacterized protein n=1 Tax=Aspergillus tanneri TaxID=1220188 RepID=A0A4S3JRS3_9EURO|nr:hypothetical protein EYZ11_002864 [Aspergillus tanneri]
MEKAHGKKINLMALADDR